MEAIFLIVVSLFFTVTLNQYFFHQRRRRWLGLNYTITSWRKLFEWIEVRFSYKRKDIEKNLNQAGFYNRVLVAIYFPAKILLAILLVAVIFTFDTQLGIVEQNQKIVWCLLSMVAVVIGPDIWLQKRRNKLVLKVSGMMPYVIDLMAVCIQTGMTIEAAITYLAEELKGFDSDLARMMLQVSNRSRLVGLNTALNELQEFYPSDEMNSFVYTLIQSLQYGSSIYDVLVELSANIREVQVLLLEEKVGKLSAKMSIPLILFIMFPIVILITAPGIMRMMG